MPAITKHNVLIILLLLSAAIFASSLYKRVITFDDAWFAERAYQLNKTGYVKSELFDGVLDWGERQYAYHKLHVWQDALIAKYIGWSPYFFKTAPLIYLLVFCYFAYRYNKRYLSPDNPETYYLFLSLLLINTYIVHFGFESRPEVMTMCVGFLSFLSMRHGIQTNKPAHLLLSGCLAGTAVLFHLNGLMYIVAGIGLILYLRQFRFLVIFILSASVISSLYWYEMISNNAIEIGLAQILNSPAVTPEAHSTSSFILKILTSPGRFFSHLFDFSYTLLLILSIYFYRKSLKGNDEVKLLLVYFVAAELTLAVINPNNKSMYLILHMPYVLFIVAALFNSDSSTSARRTMVVAFSFYAITQLGHVAGLIKKSNTEIIDQHAQIVNKYQIKKSDKIIAPAVFVFNEIGNARISAANMLHMLARERKIEFTCKGVFHYAQQHEYKYLILKANFLPEFSAADPELERDCPGYRRIGSEFDYYIFQATS